MKLTRGVLVFRPVAPVQFWTDELHSSCRFVEPVRTVAAMARMKQEHQDALCRRVRDNIISVRTGETVRLTSRPDRDNPAVGGVDETWQSESQEFVVEVTRIEAYTHQIRDNVRLNDLLMPLTHALNGTLPGTFILTVARDAAEGRVDHHETRAQLERLIRDCAGSMSPGERRTLDSPPLPFPAQIRCRDHRGSAIFPRLSIEADLDGERLRRIGRAVAEKTAQLRRGRSDQQTTVLILESDDPLLSNVFEVAKAVREVVLNRADSPDIIVLVETDVYPWQGWIFKEGDRLGDDIPFPGGQRLYELRDEESET